MGGSTEAFPWQILFRDAHLLSSGLFSRYLLCFCSLHFSCWGAPHTADYGVCTAKKKEAGDAEVFIFQRKTSRTQETKARQPLGNSESAPHHSPWIQSRDTHNCHQGGVGEAQIVASHSLGECSGKGGSRRLKLKTQVSCLQRAESAGMFISRNTGCTEWELHSYKEERAHPHGYKEMGQDAVDHGD